MNLQKKFFIETVLDISQYDIKLKILLDTTEYDRHLRLLSKLYPNIVDILSIQKNILYITKH